MTRQEASLILSDLYGETCPVQNIKPVSGGSINNCYKAETNRGVLFIKQNSRDDYPGMFEAEKKGLELLASTNTFVIPKTIGVAESGNFSFLVMEFLEQGKDNTGTWEIAGEKLAQLHKNSDSRFGLDHDNYIGSIPQSNERLSNWGDFFMELRLEPLLKQAVDLGRVKLNELKGPLSGLRKEVDGIFPDEKPALIHGDLWSGNIMALENDMPAVFDPAVYYGHREMDLGMSLLFGGFPQAFYQGYQEHYPLEKDWQKRTDICNLYPLFVHLILFGESYLMRIKSILKPF